jgi:hypothetical protein
MHPRLCLAALSLALLAAPAGAQGYLRYVPSDTRAVFVVNVGNLGGPEKKLSEEFVRKLYTGQFVPELPKLDKIPISDLKQIVVAQRYAGELSGIVLLRGKVDRALMEKQMREAAKKSKGAMVVASLGKPAAPVFSRKVNQKQLVELFPALEQVPPVVRGFVLPAATHAAALDDETVIVSLGGRLEVERALRARPAKSAPRVSDELKKLIEGLDEKDAGGVIFMEGALSDQMKLVAPEEVVEWFSRFDSAVASVKGGKTIKMTATATSKSKTEAEKLEKATDKGVKALLELISKALKEDHQKVVKKMLEGVKTTRKDKVVTITGEVGEDDLRKLLPEAKKK